MAYKNQTEKIIIALMQYTKSSTKVELAKVLGVTSNLIHTWEKRNSPNIRTIKEAIPQINTNWLLTGEGEMLEDAECVMQEMNRTKEIIQAIMRYKGIKYKSHLASMLGVNKSFVSNWESRDSYRPLISRIKEVFPEINEYWLLTGKGEMVEGKSTSMASPTSIQIVDCRMGKTNEQMVIPSFSDSTIALTFYGDSMSPLIKNGDMVLLREWEEEYIEYGAIFLIMTKSGNRMIRYIHPSKEEGCLCCVSENKIFEPLEIKREEIGSMWIVKGVISRIIF